MSSVGNAASTSSHHHRPAYRPFGTTSSGYKAPSRFAGSRGSFNHGSGRTGGHGGRFNRRSGGASIDVSRFIKKAKPAVAAAAVAAAAQGPATDAHISSFAVFPLTPHLHRTLSTKGFTAPTPIQAKAIPVILEGKDIIGLANTGTGKTAAFLLPMIHKAFLNPQQRTLIVAPTRELAQQIEQDFHTFSMHLGLRAALCVGGMPAFRQLQDLKRKPQFVIGTPGRLQDFADRGSLQLQYFNNVVIDEVDHMLDMGFIDAIKKILSGLAAARQSLFFSATMPPRIRDLVKQFMAQPVTIEIQSGVTTDNVDQDIVRVNPGVGNKFTMLTSMLARPECVKTLIFSETKREVERLAVELEKAGFKVGSIHGDKRQRERARALEQFKTGVVNILVATDVAARGLDIKDITHVINYTVPQTYDDYIHRIGRTGRAGKTGIAWTFV
jgi:superfamily II DNA/RNA helicase